MEKILNEKLKNICAVVCEYNPFHNGHAYQLEKIKALSGCDGVLCVMSGNFVQRGEPAVLSKFSRAECAVKGGADLVLELPLPFAVANAEIFAKGAVKTLAAVPQVQTLAFGCECGKKEDFFTLAKLLNDEPKAYKDSLKTHLSQGLSFAQARERALRSVLKNEMDERMFTSPNCVLGVEYTRAILAFRADLDILPIARKGAEHNAQELRSDFSSASAIRQAVALTGEISCVPDYTKELLPLFLSQRAREKLDAMELFALWEHSASFLAQISDCTEGLENGLKNALLNCFTAAEIIEKMTCKRYTSARLRRIALCNLLSLTKEMQTNFLSSALYLRPLAIKKERADEWLALLKQTAQFPLFTRKGEEESFSDAQRQLFELTVKADRLYDLLSKQRQKPFTVRFV